MPKWFENVCVYSFRLCSADTGNI